MQTKFKKDIVAEYAQQAKITKLEAEKRIDDVFEIVAGNLAEGITVKISHFFNFFHKERAEKSARNPQTGESMVIPAVRTIVAKMTKPLKERVQGRR